MKRWEKVTAVLSLLLCVLSGSVPVWHHAKPATAQSRNLGGSPTWLDPLLNKTIAQNLTPLTPRPTLNFNGAGFSVVDDSANGVTTVTNVGTAPAPLYFAGLTGLSASARQIAFLDGYASIGDGGGGLFAWDSASNATLDLCNISAGPGGSGVAGRWRRIFDGVNFSVRSCGAVGNGIANDTAAINLAIAAAAVVGGNVTFPAGTYLTTGILIQDQTVNLIGVSGPGSANSALGSIIKSTTNAPIIAYTVATNSTTTTVGSNVLPFTSTPTGFANGQHITVMGPGNNSLGMRFDWGGNCPGGVPVSPQGYAVITSIAGNNVTVNGTACLANATPVPVHRTDFVNQNARVSNLSLRGTTGSKTTTTTNITPSSSSVNVASTTGIYIGAYCIIPGAGQQIVSGGNQNELDPESQFVITNISGSTLSFWPLSRSDITLNSPIDVRCQHGLLVDNQGIFSDLLDIESTGANGLYLTGNTATYYQTVSISNVLNDGLAIDSTLGIRWRSGSTVNHFGLLSVGGSGNHNVYLNGFGTHIDYLNTSNAGKSGLYLDGMGDLFQRGLAAAQTRIQGIWSEQNTFVDQITKGANYNFVSYVHSTSGGGNTATVQGGGFSQPALGASTQITLNSTSWIVPSQKLSIASCGVYSVITNDNGTQIHIVNNGDSGNIAVGNACAANSVVTPAFAFYPADGGRSNDIEFNADNVNFYPPNNASPAQRKSSKQAIAKKQGVLSGATQTVDLQQSHNWDAVLTGNITGTPGLSLINSLEGDRVTVTIIEDGSGLRTVSNWATNIKNPDGSQFAPQLNLGPGNRNTFQFDFDGTNYWLTGRAQGYAGEVIVAAATYTTDTSNGLDTTVLVNRNGVVTITLASPGSAAIGRQITVKDQGGFAGANNITITPAAGLIDGAANFKITTNYNSATFLWDGSNWNTI